MNIILILLNSLKKNTSAECFMKDGNFDKFDDYGSGQVSTGSAENTRVMRQSLNNLTIPNSNNQFIPNQVIDFNIDEQNDENPNQTIDFIQENSYHRPDLNETEIFNSLMDNSNFDNNQSFLNNNGIVDIDINTTDIGGIPENREVLNNSRLVENLQEEILNQSSILLDIENYDSDIRSVLDLNDRFIEDNQQRAELRENRAREFVDLNQNNSEILINNIRDFRNNNRWNFQDFTQFIYESITAHPVICVFSVVVLFGSSYFLYRFYQNNSQLFNFLNFKSSKGVISTPVDTNPITLNPDNPNPINNWFSGLFNRYWNFFTIISFFFISMSVPGLIRFLKKFFK